MSSSAVWYCSWVESVDDVGEHRDAQRAVAVGGVGEVRAGHEVHHRGEHDDARLAHRVDGRVGAEAPRGDDEVGLVVDERLEQDGISSASFWPSASIVTTHLTPRSMQNR
jgi:hypothetical protein